MASPSTARRRRIIPLVIAVVLGVALILGVRACVTGGIGGTGDHGRPAPSRADRPDCTPVNVTASPEKAALLGTIADQYNKANRQVDGRCVDIRVASLASGAGAEALAQDWNEAAYGPRPDVWSPAARSWTVILQQRLAAVDRPNVVPADVPSIAQAPLVIAMPKPMAEALGWPDTPIGWSDLVALTRDPAGWGAKGYPEWGAFKLGKTNPNLSTSGLHATIATYFAATGRSSDLTGTDIADPKVIDFVRGVESGIVHYGDTTLTFLQNLYEAAQRGRGLTYISAVTVEEKSVWDYNQGNPSGNPATLGQQPKPQIPLVAIYPKDGTLMSDNPYVVPKSWTDLRKRANLVFVFDTSASMAEQVPSAGKSRLQLAKDAAVEALPLLAPDDTMSLWTFSTPLGGAAEPWRVVVPPGPISAVGDKYRQAAGGLVAEGGTALYATTRAAVAAGPHQLRPGPDQRRRAAHRREERVPAGQQPRGAGPRPAVRGRRQRRTGVPDRLRREGRSGGADPDRQGHHCGGLRRGRRGQHQTGADQRHLELLGRPPFGGLLG